jgi:VWFA-related protein
MRKFMAVTLLVGLGSLVPAWAQNAVTQNSEAQSIQQPQLEPELRVTTRAVLVDVLVNQDGRPVSGLKQNAFTVLENGKPQAISYFEESNAAPPAQAVQMPQMPPDIFTNFSPFPDPPAVNVLLLDTLNTEMDDQMVVHKQALEFLKSAKPGQRMAIFTMGLGLHFIQGFNDDPTVLAAALNHKKNDEVQNAVMIKSAAETLAQQNLIGMMASSEAYTTAASPEMIAALESFIKENDNSRSVDQVQLTLQNLQRLAAFLEGFPGRKNIIWFTDQVPAYFIAGADGGVFSGNPAVADEIKRTLSMLAAARAALYPIDARGTSNYSVYTAENAISTANSQPQQMVGVNGALAASTLNDDAVRNTAQMNEQILAEQSGGLAFANSNGLAQIINKITSSSGHFYTIAYRPTDSDMDGSFRKIEIKVSGGKYALSYRRGYYAVGDTLPGSSLAVRDEKMQDLAAKNPDAVNPLLPFMDLGMPSSEQILYKIRVYPAPAAAAPDAVEKLDATNYKVDFALDTTDLHLEPGPDGLRHGTLNISWVVYDRYGNAVSHEDHLVNLAFKPEVYDAVLKTGVQLHAQLTVPKGEYWLRTGVFDRGSRHVGTMEIPLSAVKPLETAAK